MNRHLKIAVSVGLVALAATVSVDTASARIRHGHHTHHLRSYISRSPRVDPAGSDAAGVALGLIGAGIAGATDADGYGYGGYGYGAPGYGGYGRGYYGPGYGYFGY